MADCPDARPFNLFKQLPRADMSVPALVRRRGVPPLSDRPSSCSSPPAIAADSVVVELYQSQGCSSCPPAIANVNALADRPEVLALTFAVTYWDRLGWKDTFAKPAFTVRQWDYACAAGRGEVATPQTIVNGRAVTNGGDRAGLVRMIREANRGTSAPAIKWADRRVTIAAGRPAGSAGVWLVRYNSCTLDVPIRAGENAGRTLAHRNVVRSIDRLGNRTGARVTLAVPAPGDAADRAAVLVQQGSGGPVIAAATL